MKQIYFGTDGIRGKGFEKLSAKLAFHLGNSLKEVYENNTLVIGMDTRSSSSMLAHMVASGAMLAGINVLFAGVVSTPMIAHYSKLTGIIGIMITASHNPYEDNGIKVFNKGYKSSITEELLIEKHIINSIVKIDEKYGDFSLSNEVLTEYEKLIDNLDLSKSNLKVIYDSANGANYLVAKKIINKFFPKSIQIFNEPNGMNINYNCGSTHLEPLKNAIKQNHYDLGFAFDGDGDRVIMVGNDGTVFDGDFIILLIAKYLKKHNQLKNNSVVLTKMSNPGILKALRNNGINYVLTEVGDKNVYEAMIANDYTLGGEASGHIIINHILHSGDGLLAMLYILKLIEEENVSLLELTKEVSLYPFKMVNIKNINKNVLNNDDVKKFLNKTSKAFEDTDIFYIRPSGTEPLIRVTISCEDERKLNYYMDEVVKFIKARGELKWKIMV